MAYRHRNRPLLRCLFAAVSGFIPLRAAAAADDLFHLLDNNTDVPTLSHYGGVGLLDTRTSRMLPDGYLAATVSIKNPDDRIGFTFQAFPWLETTFRWSNNYAIRPESEPGQGADRSFDIKVRLARESTYVPELAIGLQDFLGTGVYGGEYVVGSKRLGRFDLSLGLGWGRLASRGTFQNPLGWISDGLKTRSSDVGLGGKPTGDYFQGPDLGIFAGVEYQPRVHNLKIQLEYSSDAYRQEKLASGRDYSFPVNVGLSYRPWEGVDVGVSLMHGKELAVRLSLFTDLAADSSAKRIDPLPPIRPREEPSDNAPPPPPPGLVDLSAQTPPQPPPVVPAAEPAIDEESLTRMRQALVRQSLVVRGLHVEGRRVKLGIVNESYLRDAEAVSRAARALSASAPADIEEFQIITIANGVAVGDVLIRRDALDRLGRQESSPAELLVASDVSPAPSSIAELSDPNYRRFTWNIHPQIQQSLFDPDNPFYVGIGIEADEALELGRGWWLGASQSILIFDTFGDIDRVSNSVLPHVRSDIARYLKEGRYGFDSLQSSYFFKLGREVYGRATAGYLEQMFAGVGAEVLYRPFGQRWALGANLWAVQQRGYERLFALRDYQTITGHASFYYETPWNDISLRLHVGRYLARDFGYTLEAVRTFRTGVQVGAWFTITNVSAEKFGEGSFDKGIMIRIPMEWVLPFGTRSVFGLDLRPIQRDGGQRLRGAGAPQLYDMTQPSSHGEMMRQWDSVFRP